MWSFRETSDLTLVAAAIALWNNGYIERVSKPQSY